MLALCKFYRYLIYRLYHFREDTPVVNTVLILGYIHFSLILLILFIVHTFTPFDVWPDWHAYNMRLIAIVFLGLHFPLFYNKKKWKAIKNEFKGESPRHRKIGTIIVLVYLLGTTFLLFTLPVLYDIYRDFFK